MQDVDQRDRDVLFALQADIPLVGTPFALIGQSVDMSEKEIIKRVEKLKRAGVIRQIAAQFDPRALGYHSTLVAARVRPERADEAAETINRHPCVSQNYLRNDGRYNLWFSIAVAPTSRLGIDRTVAILAQEAECEAFRVLPAIRTYASAQSEDGQTDEAPEYTPLTPAEVECVRLLQRDLPLQPRPFDALARSSSMTGDDLLLLGKALLKRGQMRRFGAMIASRKSGFAASAVVVWDVPDSAVDTAGVRMSGHRAVSHSHLRPRADDWPFNLYVTVHGRSIDECESVIADLSIDTGIAERRALYPIREYKKTRLIYFTREEEAWEEERASDRAASAAS
ncbi:MAG TPA: Lrp/AsnC family transcriptional regulator [Thermoanaerobaculia bacterium]|nr:Lrp/AsnC family transcriptional regulator [Thermoanaerobaculia bacterium]